MPLSGPAGKGQGSTSVRPRSISSRTSSFKIGKIIEVFRCADQGKFVTIIRWKIAIQNVRKEIENNCEVYLLKDNSSPKKS
jgi:uncharacterized protein YqfB (UPF0267 family)